MQILGYLLGINIGKVMRVVWVVIISSQYSIEKKMNGYMLVLILGEYLCWI